MASCWPEVEQALKEKRCELVFSGIIYEKRISEKGLDPAIFDVKHLNFLEISKVNLSFLPETVGNLSNLTRLVICNNNLTILPPEIRNLKKLKFLDASHNALSDFPPSIAELTEIQSINVSYNQLTDLPDLSNMVNIVSLNISHNQFSSLPTSICHNNLFHFTDLIANNNLLSIIPHEIGMLGNLKVLNLADNSLVSVPGELGSCSKLKELNLKGNNLKDRRLLKLVEQCHVKQIMDYIRSHCHKSDTQSKQKKKEGKKNLKEAPNNDVVDEQLKVLLLADDSLKVVVTQKVSEVRPYIVCCKVLDFNFYEDLSLLKRFITLQTKIHDGVCEKRTVATIATHDFSKIHGDLLYDARTPTDILITPLNSSSQMTAAELYDKLSKEADVIRKEKKKNAFSGIHKYLYLLKDKEVYPCLIDTGSDSVISFPPITNSDVTKITSDTRELFLEVTGNSLNSCKKVMDTLLLSMVQLREKPLTVQQMRVVDVEGHLRVIYPSRTDLQGISVTRCS